MFDAGVAITFGPVDELNEADGLHEYVFAPPAVRAMLCPLQMVSSGDTNTFGDGFTLTVSCAVDEQPFELPVTVYVVVEEGLAMTLEPMDALSVEAGLHI